jgi:hypothetical protein
MDELEADPRLEDCVGGIHGQPIDVYYAFLLPPNNAVSCMI